MHVNLYYFLATFIPKLLIGASRVLKLQAYHGQPVYILENVIQINVNGGSIFAVKPDGGQII